MAALDALAKALLLSLGFRRHVTASGHGYWLRQPPAPASGGGRGDGRGGSGGGGRSQRLPLLFLHGVGLGFPGYMGATLDTWAWLRLQALLLPPLLSCLPALRPWTSAALPPPSAGAPFELVRYCPDRPLFIMEVRYTMNKGRFEQYLYSLWS